MRLVAALLPILCISIACSATLDDEEGSDTSNLSEDEDKANSSIAFGPCRSSRDAILASVSSERAAVLSRGFEWLDANVPFDMDGRHDAYRTDCSGFVSMCHELGAPGKTTRQFGTPSSHMYKLGGYNELVPADILVNPGHHSFLFLGWNDTSRSGMCVLEMASTKSDMQFRVRITSTLKSEGFMALRTDALRDDTEFKDTTKDTKETKETSSETNQDKTSAKDDACAKARSVTEICTEAKKTSGVECGRIKDDCDRPVNCGELSTFTCAENSTCVANRCQGCKAKTAEAACLEAKNTDGVQCGLVSDGCGGKVRCDTVAGFGCTDGQRCGIVNTNKCSTPKTTDPTPDPGSTSTGSESSQSTSETRDDADRGDDRSSVSASDAKSASDKNAEDAEDEGDAGAAPAKKKKKTSSGCSTTPAGSDSGALGGVGVMLAIALASRRRTKRGLLPRP